MADNNLKNVKVTEQMIEQAQRNAMSGILDPEHPELTVEILKQNAAEFRKRFTEELKKLKFEELGKKLQNELLTDVKKEFSRSQGFWKKAADFLAGGQGAGSDSFEQMYRTRQRFGGLEQLFQGNFKAGLSQIAGSFTALSRIMNGPYVAAITAVIAGLNALDKQLAKVNTEAFSATGGYLSPYRNANAAEIQRFHNRNYQALTDLKMREQFGEISSSIIQNFSTARRQKDFSDLVDMFAYGRKSFSSLGIDNATSDRIMTMLGKNEGLNKNQSLAFIRRMQESVVGHKGSMSDKQIIEETMKGFDANKKFNLSMNWVNKQVLKFNDALEKGTRSMDDFAAIQRSFYGGDTGQLAGLANIIAESASMTGVEVPPELIQNLNNPYALKMLMSDPEVMKKLGPGLQATAKRFASESGNAGNTLAEQGFLGDILKNLMNVNVSRQAVIDLQKSGYDFQKSGLLGTGSGVSINTRIQDQMKIEEESKSFQTDIQGYTKRVTTIMESMSQDVGAIKDNMIQAIKDEGQRRVEERERYQQVLSNKESSTLEKFLATLGQANMSTRY